MTEIRFGGNWDGRNLIWLCNEVSFTQLIRYGVILMIESGWHVWIWIWYEDKRKISLGFPYYLSQEDWYWMWFCKNTKLNYCASLTNQYLISRITDRYLQVTQWLGKIVHLHEVHTCKKKSHQELPNYTKSVLRKSKISGMVILVI